MLLRQWYTFTMSTVIHLCLLHRSLESESRWKRRRHFRQPVGNWIFFLVRSYPNFETNDDELVKSPVNTEADRLFPNPIPVFITASDLQCVGEHYHVEELSCLCSLISTVFLPNSSSCCPVGDSRYLLWSIDYVLWRLWVGIYHTVYFQDWNPRKEIAQTKTILSYG